MEKLFQIAPKNSISEVGPKFNRYILHSLGASDLELGFQYNFTKPTDKFIKNLIIDTKNAIQ